MRIFSLEFEVKKEEQKAQGECGGQSQGDGATQQFSVSIVNILPNTVHFTRQEFEMNLFVFQIFDYSRAMILWPGFCLLDVACRTCVMYNVYPYTPGGVYSWMQSRILQTIWSTQIDIGSVLIRYVRLYRYTI